MPVERSAGAVVYRETKKGREYLLLQHHADENTRVVKRTKVGHWDFPKGHIDPGEKTEDTVRREVREETGIMRIELIPGFKETIRYFVHPVREKSLQATEVAPTGAAFSNEVNYTQEKRLKFVAFFLARTSKKKVTISWEHQGYAWLPYKEAYQRLTYQNAKKVLEHAELFLKKPRHEIRNRKINV